MMNKFITLVFYDEYGGEYKLENTPKNDESNPLMAV